jgi:hypothetical protein
MSSTRRNVAHSSGFKFPGADCCTLTSTSLGRVGVGGTRGACNASSSRGKCS